MRSYSKVLLLFTLSFCASQMHAQTARQEGIFSESGTSTIDRVESNFQEIRDESRAAQAPATIQSSRPWDQTQAATRHSAQELKQLVDTGRWEEARHLMQVMLARHQHNFEQKLQAEDPENGLHENRALYASNIEPLLNRPHDEMYKMIEADVRANLATAVLVRWYNEEKENPEERDEAMAELRKVVEKQFETRLAISEHEVQQLEKRLEKIQAQLARRKELAQTIIDRRVNQLLGQADELDWNFGIKQPKNVVLGMPEATFSRYGNEPVAIGRPIATPLPFPPAAMQTPSNSFTVPAVPVPSVSPENAPPSRLSPRR